MTKKNNNQEQLDLFDLYRPDNREIELEKIRKKIKDNLDSGNINKAKEFISEEKAILDAMIKKD